MGNYRLTRSVFVLSTFTICSEYCIHLHSRSKIVYAPRVMYKNTLYTVIFKILYTRSANLHNHNPVHSTFMICHRVCNKSNWMVPRVEQELFTFPEHHNSSHVFVEFVLIN